MVDKEKATALLRQQFEFDKRTIANLRHMLKLSHNEPLDVTFEALSHKCDEALEILARGPSGFLSDF